MITLMQVIQELRPGAQCRIIGDTYNDITWDDKNQTIPTEDEVDKKLKELQADEPMALDAGGEEEGEEEDEEEMLEEALRGINYIPSKKEIVKTVAQRVAKRLNEAKQAEARLNKALGKRR